MSKYHRSPILTVALVALVLSSVGFGPREAHAQYVAQAPDTVLISNSLASVTRREYDGELLKLPADMREGFANNPKRVNDLLVRMLVQKSLATQARTAKLDAVPDNAARIALEVDRLLAGLQIESVDQASGKEFDADVARYETRARETYLVNKAAYTEPAQISASHILFDTTKKNTSAEARRKAEEVRAKLVAGADFATLAKELSDDPASGQVGGQLGWFAEKQMDTAFAAAALALQKPGDLSQPVESVYGWHIIRLEGKRPGRVQAYDEAKPKILAELKRRHIEQSREAAIAAIRTDPKTELNQQAFDALIPKIDPEAIRRATEAAKRLSPAPAK